MLFDELPCCCKSGIWTIWLCFGCAFAAKLQVLAETGRAKLSKAELRWFCLVFQKLRQRLRHIFLRMALSLLRASETAHKKDPDRDPDIVYTQASVQLSQHSSQIHERQSRNIQQTCGCCVDIGARLPLLCLLLHVVEKGYVPMIFLWACDMSASALAKLQRDVPCLTRQFWS